METHHQREVEVAWCAGFLDGEGCIALGAAGSARIDMDQVVRSPLEKFKQVFGGKIYRYQREHGMVWRWTGRGELVGQVLQECLPHLTGKAAEARIMLQYLQFRRDNRSGRTRTPELQRAFMKARFQLSALKRRGPGVPRRALPSARHPGRRPRR